MLTAVEDTRGFGGCGFAPEGGGLNGADSLVGLLNAIGFLGSGGADFIAFDTTEEECFSLSALISELNLLNAGDSSTSSSDDRSIKFGADLCAEDFLSGNFGCLS